MLKNISNIEYSLIGFNISKFVLLEPDQQLKDKIELDKFEIGVSLNLGYNKEHDRIFIEMGILFPVDFNERKINILDFKFVSEFHVINLNEILIQIGEDIKFPTELLNSIVSISYSSARGMIFAKTQGSFLNKIILPLINPNELVNSFLNKFQSEQ